MGYSKVVVTDSISSIENVSIGDYDHTYFYPTITKSFTQRAGTNDTINIVTNTWANLILDTDRKRIFPFMQSAKQVDKLTGHYNTTSAQYDNFGNPTSIVKSFNNGVTESTTNQFSNSETSWLLVRPTNTTIQYSDNDTTITRTTTRVFGSNNNNLISETLFPGTSNEITNIYHYNLHGIQDKDSTISGGSSRTVSSIMCTDNIRVFSTKDVLGHVTTNTYDNYGYLNKQQNYLGNTISYTYDEFGRQISSALVDGSQQTLDYGWENQETEPLLARYSILKTSNDGSQSKIWYDKLGRQVRSDVKGFDGNWIYSMSAYNNKGQIVKVSDPYYSSDSPLWTEFIYDNYGRKTRMNRPSGRNSSWDYASNVITETTGEKEFIKTYASDGTMSSAEDAGGKINYTFYPDGKLRTITAPGGIITRSYYDQAGNQKKLVDPSAGTIRYTYNGFGDLTVQQTPGSKTTTISYDSYGKIVRKVTPEGTTKYRYNTNKQLINIGSPDNVSRTLGYDNHGRIISTIDSIPEAEHFATSFSYDGIGRLSTITHPSGIIETNNFNSNGYISSISAGGGDRWTTENINARGQVTAGHYANNLIATYDYDPYGFSTSIVTGSIQNFSYSFNHTTGNLTWRKKGLNLREDFQYDNLDRLDSANVGSFKLGMQYDSENGGITIKSDAGTFHYDNSSKPYAVSSINPSTGLISSKDSINYTSFEKVESIFENKHSATFLYNSDNERSRMIVTDSVGTILTRWYPSDNCIKETDSNATKLYTFIGGDIYSAPVVAITKNDTTIYYDLLRDNLGNITHVVNSTNNKIAAEYSYDPWGRMRNPETWVDYVPDSIPILFVAGRGFTGHEHLPWFNLLNMNGRIYDPLIGSFLSPDNNVQAPDFTQNLNRYAYCLNNPLKYTDQEGESFILAAAIIAGWINMGQALINSDKHGWGLVGDLAKGFAIGAGTGAAGAWAGGAVAGSLKFGGFAGGFISGAAGGGAAGFISGSGTALANGSNIGQAMGAGLINGGIGAVLSGAIGGVISGIDAMKNDVSFWKGIYETGGYEGPGTFLNEDIPAGTRPTELGLTASTDNNVDYGNYGWTRTYANGDLKPHFGVDYQGDIGQDVFATYDGTVIKPSNGFYRDYGKYSIRTSSIINSKTYNVDYGHLSGSPLSIGKAIKAGDLVGYMGRLGSTMSTLSPTHVHIAIWRPIIGCRSMGFVRPHWY